MCLHKCVYTHTHTHTHFQQFPTTPKIKTTSLTMACKALMTCPQPTSPHHLLSPDYICLLSVLECIKLSLVLTFRPAPPPACSVLSPALFVAASFLSFRSQLKWFFLIGLQCQMTQSN